MHALAGLIYVSSLWPLVRAWRANRATSLQHALAWTSAAWLAWGLLPWVDHDHRQTMRYFALCLSSCVGVAVLGARRPLVQAWNFVLLGLLAVLLLPWLESLVLATQLFNPLRLAFVIGTLLVGVLNYLPTRLALTALLLAAACAAELAILVGLEGEGLTTVGSWLIPLACWTGLLARPGAGAVTEFDRLWRAFRDRFGVFWAQRLREQFNRTAENAGWPVRLHWGGLRLISRVGVLSSSDPDEMLQSWKAMLKRFLDG